MVFKRNPKSRQFQWFLTTGLAFRSIKPAGPKMFRHQVDLSQMDRPKLIKDSISFVPGSVDSPPPPVAEKFFWQKGFLPPGTSNKAVIPSLADCKVTKLCCVSGEFTRWAVKRQRQQQGKHGCTVAQVFLFQKAIWPKSDFRTCQRETLTSSWKFFWSKVSHHCDNNVMSKTQDLILQSYFFGPVSNAPQSQKFQCQLSSRWENGRMGWNTNTNTTQD